MSNQKESNQKGKDQKGSDQKGSFWQSSSGFIKALAGLITAIVALIGALAQMGIFKLPAAATQAPTSASVVATSSSLPALAPSTSTSVAAPLTSAPVTVTSTPSGAITSKTDGMTLLYVPAGNFTMGSDTGNPNEIPAHLVYLDAFRVDQTDITNRMYAVCANAGGCAWPSRTDSNTHSNYYLDPNLGNFPVIRVTWNDAANYCAWAGRRLPTEAEWEKAARGTDARTYPWGSGAPNPTLLNFDSEIGDPTAVGQYPSGASPYGALDMAGNVWNWVNDWYGETYYAGAPTSNPSGPSSGLGHVIRGGSWYEQDAAGVRSAFRGYGTLTDTYPTLGFRCAASP